MLARRLLNRGLLTVGSGLLIAIGTTVVILCLYLLSNRQGDQDGFALATVIMAFISTVRQHLPSRKASLIDTGLCCSTRHWHGRIYDFQILSVRRCTLPLPATAYERSFQRGQCSCLRAQCHTLCTWNLITFELCHVHLRSHRMASKLAMLVAESLMGIVPCHAVRSTLGSDKQT